MSEPASFTAGTEVSRVTRLAIAEAGLTRSRRRTVPGLVLAATLLTVSAALGILASGSGDERPVVVATEELPALVPVVDASLADGTATPTAGSERIRSALWGESDDLPELAAIRPATPAHHLNARERELLSLYQELDRQKHEVRPRRPAKVHPAPSSAPSARELTLASAGSVTPAAPSKNEIPRLESEDLPPDRLPDSQVSLTIQKRSGRLQRCHQRQLQRDPTVAGRVVVVAHVAPSGRVARARVTTSRIQGTYLEECLIGEIERWRFPAFEGQEQVVNINLLLAN